MLPRSLFPALDLNWVLELTLDRTGPSGKARYGGADD